MFQLGRTFPIENLGIYANLLAASVTIENWLHALVVMLNDLDTPKAAFSTRSTIERIELHIPIRPSNVMTQCVIAGLLFRLICISELAAKNLIHCNLHSKFIENTGAEETSKQNTLISIYVKRKNLTSPLTYHNKRIYGLFLRQLAIYQKGKQNRNNIEYNVLREVMQTSDWTTLSQSLIASKLAMSERSLTLKLQKERLKFRDIVVTARNTHALTLLFEGVPIDKVSEILGFSDRATFERSFKKWQGLSPAKIQAQYVVLASEARVQTIINVQDLPHLPATMAQLIKLLKKDCADIDEVVRLLQTGPVLVAKILRKANSSIYSNIKAANLKKAVIAVFGFDKLYALVLSIISTATFSTRITSFNYNAFWHYALFSAWVVEQIMNTIDGTKEEKETHYLAGLLHNIGELVIHFCLPNKTMQSSADFSEQITWREHNRYQTVKIGTCTTKASSFVCYLWHIPKPVCELLNSLSQQDEIRTKPLVDALDIVDYLMLPTAQTQSTYQGLIEKYWGKNQNNKKFLINAERIRDELRVIAHDLI